MNTIRKILNKVAEMHPYKVSGQHDTFSQYNEGWIDAIDQLEQELEEAGVIEKIEKRAFSFEELLAQLDAPDGVIGFVPKKGASDEIQ